MAHSYAPEQPYTQPVPGTRLQGRRLFMARVTWAILVTLTLGLFAAMLPAYFAQLQVICTGPACALGQPSLEAVRTLQVYGLTVGNYAGIAVGLNIFVLSICVVTAVLIIWRRSDDWVALLIALTLVVEGTTFITYTLEFSQSAWQMPAALLGTFSWGVVFLTCPLFPDGRFVPRWARWLVVVWLGFNIVAIAFPSLYHFTPVSNLIWICLSTGCIASQIYRYMIVSSPLQRQQTKWIVYGTSLGTTVVIALEIPILLLPGFGPGSFYNLVSWYGFILALIPFPISVGFAMMRSRLWDIDIIIRRTLIYALLTVLLALVYAACVVLLQYVFRALTGQGSPLAIVVSTLAIAALFHPLRHYIQTIIDSSFFRRKYNAPQVLADFDAAVIACLYSGDEKSLETLTSTMQEIVDKTLQPQQIGLWLYDVELPQEGAERAIREQFGLNGEAPEFWDDQDESPREIHLQVPEGSISRPLQSEEQYRQGTSPRPLKRGYPRIIARGLWLALAGLAVWLFIAAIPYHEEHLHVVCANIMCGGSQTVSQVTQQLSEIGLTRGFFANYTLVVESIFALVYFITAVIIFRRKSDDLMALLVGIFLITFALAFTDIPHVLGQSNALLRWLSAGMGFAGEMALPLCFYLFPNGRFVPTWARWLLPGWFLWGIFEYFFPGAPFRSSGWFLLLEGLAFAAGLGSIVISQVYRYFFVSSATQKQQTKWVVFGMALALGGFLSAGLVGFVVPLILAPPASTLPVTLGIIANGLTYPIMLLIPIALASALLRYRLWDIDVLINRTLIYGTLAVVLGLVSIGILIAQQELARALPTVVWELFVVGSILAIVMCFQVLLRNIQSFIDRHFYRHKYQAERTLERFTTSLRHEMNLAQLSEGLLEAVSEAMEPADVSLWINGPEPMDEVPRYTGVLRL